MGLAYIKKIISQIWKNDVSAEKIDKIVLSLYSMTVINYLF